MQAHILVTGANGFVGRAVCARFAHEGMRLRAAVRSEMACADLGVPCVPVGEISLQTDWSRALEHIDIVVHLAARAHVMHDHGSDLLEAYRRVNVGGTEALVRQAVAAKVRRIVFLSSVKVNGESRDLPGFNEADPAQPEDAYGVSKLEAEQRLAAFCAQTSTEYVVLRPPLVYGPGVKGNLASLIRLIDRGIPLPLSGVDNRRSLIGVDNLVEAIRLAASHPAAAGRTFLIGDDRPVSSAELAREIALALGRSPRLLTIPVSLLHLAGILTARSGAVRRLTSSLVVDSRAIRATLGFRTISAFPDGIRAMIRSYRNG